MAIFHFMKYDVKCGTCLHKFDCRKTTLSNAANHFKIFLIEFEIYLYKHLYFLYIRNPLFPLLSLFPCYGSLKLTCFIPKIVFQLYETSKSAITFDRVLIPPTVCSIDKTNMFFTLSMKNVLFILYVPFFCNHGNLLTSIICSI